jgi:hypothetical protein
MRFVLAAIVCIASLVSTANAQEVLRPLRTSVTYWSETNTLDFWMQFSRPLNLDDDSVQFLVFSPAGQWEPDDGLRIHNGNSVPERSELFTLEHNTYVDPGPGIIVRTLGHPDYELTDNSIRFLIPFEITDVNDPVFDFYAALDGLPRGSGPIRGVSSVDSVVVYVPEPSSVALASLGVIGLIVHRLRRRHRS